jgi:hypothetical protein
MGREEKKQKKKIKKTGKLYTVKKRNKWRGKKKKKYKNCFAMIFVSKRKEGPEKGGKKGYLKFRSR